VPAFLTLGVVETTLYVTYIRTTADVELARTMLTAVAVLCGLAVVLFVRPPTAWWSGDAPLARDWRVVALVVLLAAATLGVFVNAALRSFFSLSPLGVLDIAIIVVVTAAWTLALRAIWQRRLLNRMLGLDRVPVTRS
jgi:hypothetical protein